MKKAQLHTALRNLDVDACMAAIGHAGLADSAEAWAFLDCIRRSGGMVIEWENGTQEAARDTLASKCRDLLVASGDSDAVDAFQEHLAAARIIEQGFRRVKQTLAEHPVSARTPAEQVWGLLRWIEAGIEQFDEQVEAAIAGNPSLHDIQELRVRGKDGQAVVPNSVINGVVQAAGNTILMLGYRHRLFDSDNILILPEEPSLGKTAIEEAGALMFLSSAWTQLRRGWERVRFFGGEVRIEHRDVPVADAGTRSVQMIEFSVPDAVERLDRIAMDRLGQRLVVNQIDMATQTNVLEHVKLPGQETISLPPTGWVSIEEFNASHSLATHYFLPIDSDEATVLELPLKAWLRGYAVYARCLARDKEDRAALQILSYTEADLVQRLSAVGLSAEQAAQFIRHTTFGRHSKDLFDTPLIRSEDGRLFFFAPAYLSPNPGAVLISRLGRLNVRVDEKGKRFERHTLKLFRDAGIPAHSFKYTADGQKRECDVAVLWDETLFVFECKNCGLPDGHLPSLHRFVEELSGHINQANTIAWHLNENPDIVRKHFGAKASWKRVVPCVLNALPWSAGKLGDVYCYDSSALGRFFEEGFIAIKMTTRVTENTRVTRRHKFPLWSGDAPTALDLLRELERPTQLRLPLAQWEITAKALPLSTDMAVVVPGWTPRELSLKEKFRIYGATEEEAEKLIKEFEEFPAAAEELRACSDREGSASP